MIFTKYLVINFYSATLP